MKKQYINPAIVIVKVEVQHLMAGSLDPEKGTGTASQQDAPGGIEAESRRGGFWDE